MATNDRPSMYVGSGKLVVTSTGKEGFRLQLDIDDLGRHLRGDGKEFIREWKDREGITHRTINLALWPLQSENVTEYRTHSLKIDTWKPDPSKAKQRNEPPPVAEHVADEFGGEVVDDQEALPF